MYTLRRTPFGKPELAHAPSEGLRTAIGVHCDEPQPKGRQSLPPAKTIVEYAANEASEPSARFAEEAGKYSPQSCVGDLVYLVMQVTQPIKYGRTAWNQHVRRCRAQQLKLIDLLPAAMLRSRDEEIRDRRSECGSPVHAHLRRSGDLCTCAKNRPWVQKAVDDAGGVAQRPVLFRSDSLRTAKSMLSMRLPVHFRGQRMPPRLPRG